MLRYPGTEKLTFPNFFLPLVVLYYNIFGSSMWSFKTSRKIFSKITELVEERNSDSIGKAIISFSMSNVLQATAAGVK